MSNRTRSANNYPPFTNKGQDRKKMSVSNSSLSGVTTDKGNNILDAYHSNLKAKLGETKNRMHQDQTKHEPYKNIIRVYLLQQYWMPVHPEESR